MDTTRNTQGGPTPEYQRDRYHDRARQGRCIYCGEPVDHEGPQGGQTLCPVHAPIRAKANQGRRDRLVEQGICYVCGKRPRGETRACEECRERTAARRRELRRLRGR